MRLQYLPVLARTISENHGSQPDGHQSSRPGDARDLGNRGPRVGQVLEDLDCRDEIAAVGGKGNCRADAEMGMTIPPFGAILSKP